jgi:hypothetical protein
MSTSTTPVPTAAPTASLLRWSAGPVRRGGARIRQAVAYVALLVWGAPLAAFVVAATRADAAPCVPAGDLPCDGQGVVVITAVLVATLLIPVGLLAMVVVAVLATTLPGKAPSVLAAVVSVSVAVVAAGAWGVFTLVTS